MKHPLALEGIRIIEVCNVAAGPFCGMLLADMGADVVKLEHPEGGDTLRAWPPISAGFSENFASLNRNKRSVALDLKRPADLGIAHQHVGLAEILPDIPDRRARGEERGVVEHRPQRTLADGERDHARRVAVHHGIREEVGGWLGPTVLALYGLSYIGVAFARCDPGCQAATPSLHHRIHFLLGDVIILAAVLGPFTLYPRIAKDPLWRSLGIATLVLPGGAWAILELSGIGLSGALRQRLWLLLIFVWIELVAVRLIRLARGRPALASQAAA